jgi:hypothetical protein
MSPNSKVLKTSRTKLHNCTRTLSKLAEMPNPRLALSRQNSNDSDSDSSVSNGRCIEITSGPARTHSTLLDTISTAHGARLAHKDVFICKGAVDVVKLLVLSRRTLYATAKECGGNVLLDEQWCCKISQPKFRKQNRFRVKIQYSATAARSYWPDPQRPVQTNAAKGIDGLMTILHRKE